MVFSKTKIKEAMARQNIKTFAELSTKIGITKNQLSVMLSDRYNPLKARADELCRILQVRPDEVMDFCQTVTFLPYNSPLTKEVTAIELFAGAGGLALGLEQAGIQTLEYIEFDRTCCDTLKKNRPNWNVVCDDIHHVDFSAFADKVDIVTGGFPCQAFSYAGKKLGFEDTRGTLFHEFARCVKEVRPKIFLAENFINL